MPDDRFRGKFIIRRPGQDRVDEGEREGGVRLPVILNPNDPARSKTVWVKAAYAPLLEPLQGQTSKAEAALREVFEEVQAQHTDAAGSGGGKGEPPIDADSSANTEGDKSGRGEGRSDEGQGSLLRSPWISMPSRFA